MKCMDLHSLREPCSDGSIMYICYVLVSSTKKAQDGAYACFLIWNRVLSWASVADPQQKSKSIFIFPWKTSPEV